MAYQCRPPQLHRVGLQCHHERRRAALAAPALMYQQLLHGAAERPRLRVGHREHHHAHDLGALGAARRRRRGEGRGVVRALADEDPDAALPVVDLGDALLPPGQQLLV